MKATTPLRLVTLPVLALAGLPSCKRNADARMDPEWWKLEADRVELVQEVKLQKMRLGDGGQAREHAAAKGRVERNEARLVELKADKEALTGEISTLVASLEKQYAKWVTETRAAAVGRSYEWLEAKNGRRYEDVTITKVSDVGIEFRHSTGSARLAAMDLNVDLQGMFALDSLAAEAAIAEERAAASAYEAWVDERMEVVNAEKKEAARLAADREDERQAELAKARSEARAASLAENENRGSRLYDAPRSFGTGRYTTWYPDDYYSGNYYYYNSGNRYCSPAINPLWRYGGNYRNYTRAFAISVSGGANGTPRVTPSFTSGAPARTTAPTPPRRSSVTTIPRAPVPTTPVP